MGSGALLGCSIETGCAVLGGDVRTSKQACELKGEERTNECLVVVVAVCARLLRSDRRLG